MYARLLVILLAALPLFSQTYTGTIRGRVDDPSGAAVPATQVTVT